VSIPTHSSVQSLQIKLVSVAGWQPNVASLNRIVRIVSHTYEMGAM
jgi:hypothetical protein